MVRHSIPDKLGNIKHLHITSQDETGLQMYKFSLSWSNSFESCDVTQGSSVFVIFPKNSTNYLKYCDDICQDMVSTVSATDFNIWKIPLTIIGKHDIIEKQLKTMKKLRSNISAIV